MLSGIPRACCVPPLVAVPFLLTTMIFDASSTFNAPENLSMVHPAGGRIPGYAGHQPGHVHVIGQRQSAATAHMVCFIHLLLTCLRAAHRHGVLCTLQNCL
jgi:hypothetical protein